MERRGLSEARRSDGYNPIRHKCESKGCYLQNFHPKTEWFAPLFPGKINFSDMDRIVEVAGRALVLEWKGYGGEISKGQEIMWGRLTRGTMMTTIAVEGDPKSMDVSAYRICFNGKWQDWKEGGLLDLTDRIKKWNDWASSNPVFSIAVNK